MDVQSLQDIVAYNSEIQSARVMTSVMSWAPFAAFYAAFLVAIRGYNNKFLDLIKGREKDFYDIRLLISEFSASCRILYELKCNLTRLLHCRAMETDLISRCVIANKMQGEVAKCQRLISEINVRAPDSIYKRESLKAELEKSQSDKLVYSAAKLAMAFLPFYIEENSGGDKDKKNDGNKNNGKFSYKFRKNVWSLAKQFTVIQVFPNIVGMVSAVWQTKSSIEWIDSDIVKGEEKKDLELSKQVFESCLEQSLMEAKGEGCSLYREYDLESLKKNGAALEVQLLMLNTASSSIIEIYNRNIHKMVRHHLFFELFLGILLAILMVLFYKIING